MIQFDLSQVAGWLINIGAILAFFSGAYFALRKWVQKAAQEAANASNASREVRRQLKTSNGRTIAEYVENSAHVLDELVEDNASVRELLNATILRLEQHLADHESTETT